MQVAPSNARGWAKLAFRVGVFLMVLGGLLIGIIAMPGKSHVGALPALSADDAALRDRLRGHVEMLAGTIGERNVDRPRALDRAKEYVASALESAAGNVETQSFDAAGVTVENVEARIAGNGGGDEVVVLGAHYDSAPGTPGANDNATGVAALLELARVLRDAKPAREVRLVAFVNEEPPFFQTSAMGSVVYAKRLKSRGERVAAMVSLETIGFYDDRRGSQKYPPILSALYPDTGNFLGFVANVGSRRLVRRAIGLFREEVAFPSEGIAAPALLPGIAWSDQWAFWEEGWPAIMVTDTAPFRYPHYHMPTDTPEKVDYDRLARVTAGMARVIAALAR